MQQKPWVNVDGNADATVAIGNVLLPLLQSLYFR